MRIYQTAKRPKPVQDIESILCLILYKGDWAAKSSKHLKTRILNSVKKIDIEITQIMIRSIRSKYAMLKIMIWHFRINF